MSSVLTGHAPELYKAVEYNIVIKLSRNAVLY